MKVNEVVSPVRWDAIEQFLGKITVRINQSDPMTRHEMLNDEIPQQSRFSRTRFSNQIEVLAVIRNRKADRVILAPNFPRADL